MPKIKVPTSPLKRPARIPRRPLDVVTCIADIKGTETAKEKKNGLKTKEKLCTTSSKEVKLFLIIYSEDLFGSTPFFVFLD